MRRRKNISGRFFFFLISLTVFVSIVPLKGKSRSTSLRQNVISGDILYKEVLNKANSATLRRFPNSDSVLVYEKEQTSYNPDGTSVTHDEVFEKVLTERGKRENKTLSFYFTLPYSNLSLNFLEIIKPEGTRISVDVKKNSKVMINRAQMSQNIYNPNSKILVVSLPNLEINDIIHYSLERKLVKPRVPNTWSDYYVLEYTMPIMHYIIEISAPKTLPLVNIRLRDEIKNTVVYSEKKNGDKIIYRWEVKNVPRTYKEPNMPPLYTVVQRLLVSTIPNWKYVSQWYWKLCKPHLETVTPEMKQKVGELISECNTDREKIKAIFYYVSQHIRYMGITTEKTAPGYEPHDVNITFENKYGVCRDKAALLVAMLRIAGFDAYPVLINVGPKKDKEVPQPYFNHAISCVEIGKGRYMLMDPTDENTKDLFPPYLCDKSFLVAKPEGDILRISPVIPVEKNLLKINTQARLTKTDTLDVKCRLSFYGINDNAYRGYFVRIKSEQRKKFFEGRLKSRFPSAELKELKILPEHLRDVSKTLEVILKFEVKNFLVKAKKYLLMPRPLLGTSFGVVNFVIGRTGLKKRKYPLETDTTCGVKESFSLRLPDNISSALFIPHFKKINNKVLLWDTRYQYNKKDNSVSGISEFLIKTVEVMPDEYKALKASLKEIESNNRKRLIFEKTVYNKQDEVLIIVEKKNYKLLSPNSWILKIYKKFKILNYAGKKKYAELKINYNPIWSEVKFKDVRVYNKGQKAKSVSPEEVNIMDAGWVGEAPRYPGEKTMVISLPDVDIGSVIEYTIERKCFGRPLFFIRDSFRYSVPLKYKEISVTVPLKYKLYYKFFSNNCNITVNFKKNKLTDTVTYLWTVKDVPAIKSEDRIPPWWTFNPTLYISNKTWREYLSVILSGLKEKISGHKIVIAKTNAIINGLKSDIDKIRAIRDFVCKNIRTAGPNFLSLPLSELSSAEVTLKDGYGNMADKAILLYVMLKNAGFSPKFTFAGHLPLEILHRYIGKYAHSDIFEDLLIKVATNGKTIYLNDTNQYSKLGSTAHEKAIAVDLCNIMQGSDTGNIFYSIIPEPQFLSKRKLFFKIIILNNSDVLISKKIEYYGMNYAFFTQLFSEMRPEKRRRYFMEKVNALSAAAEPTSPLTTNYKVYPGIESFSVRIPNYVVRSKNLAFMKLPGSSLFKYFLNFRENQRKYPLFLGAGDISASYIIEFKGKIKSLLRFPVDFTYIFSRFDSLSSIEKLQYRCGINPGLPYKETANFISLNTKFNNNILNICKRIKLSDDLIISSIQYRSLLFASECFNDDKENIIVFEYPEPNIIPSTD